MATSWLFFKLHNGFPEHHKTLELSDKAFRQLIEAWCYCSRNLNDGQLSKTQFFRLFSPKSRQEVIGAGFVVKVGETYEMHDYLVHQESAEKVADRRNKRIEAGKLGGKAKASNLANASADAKQTASKPLADIDRDKDKKEKTPSSPAKPSMGFDQFWSVYPKKVSKQAAIKAWNRAVKVSPPEEIILGAKRYAEAERGTEKRFLKGPDGWLNAGRWQDETLMGADGEIDVDAILGRDLWQLPAPPDDLPAHEYKAWAIRVRREHDEQRYAEAQKRVSA
jgi:hypothetical protein